MRARTSASTFATHDLFFVRESLAFTSQLQHSVFAKMSKTTQMERRELYTHARADDDDDFIEHLMMMMTQSVT